MAIAGLVLCLVGSVLLGVSSWRASRAVETSLSMLELTVESLAGRGDAVVFQNMDKMRLNSMRHLRWAVSGGWFLLALGTLLQVLAAL